VLVGILSTVGLRERQHRPERHAQLLGHHCPGRSVSHKTRPQPVRMVEPRLGPVGPAARPEGLAGPRSGSLPACL
jgi:hypothetical protein